MRIEAYPPRRLRAFVLPVLCTVLALTPTLLPAQGSSGEHVNRKSPFSAITVLGDSLSDTGRLFAAIGIPPAPYFNGRSSNGPLWIEYLSPDLRIVYQPLDNFAWAGANTGRLNVWGAGLPGMLDELDEFLAPLPHRADPRALYVVFGGANDFIRILVGGENPNAVIPPAVANLLTIIRTLHATGAHDIVVMDLPNIGLTPRARAAGPVAAAAATALSVWFNQLLGAGLDALDFPVVRVSVFQLTNAIAAAPASFGVTNTTGMGINDLAHADTYMFFDDVHPTTRVHGYIAGIVFDALEDAGLLKQLLKHPSSIAVSAR